MSADAPYLGLPWPDEYDDLQAPLREQWGVDGDIYLRRQLSGKSGALVYAVDLACRDFSGEAILKFDLVTEPEEQEDNEAARHNRAFEAAPEYSATHLPRVLHTLHHGRSIAILSTIAGRGLTYATPWELCAHERQLAASRRLSRGLLEDWNSGYDLPAGMMRPQDLLAHWLGDRLDSNVGKIFGFLKDRCGIAPTQPSVIFHGTWYPNPLAFALSESDMMERVRLRGVRGNVHGDLNGHNVLVGERDAADDSYYLIDLAHYESGQYLFLDNDYVGFSHLLAVRENVDAARWDSLLAHVSHRKGDQSSGAMRGDDLGPIEVIKALRGEVVDWIERHESNRLSFMEAQLILASVAVGLNFASKGIEERLRRLGFMYAAACLRSYLELHNLDWPRHGPLFVLETGVQASSVIKGEIALSADDHPELPDKLAIAVLAFKNLSAEPDQEYFADGMTEEISTMLSHSDWLMVISRGSTFAYKGRDVPMRQIAQELGVHYVVEGTVQKAGNKIRVTVQLTDAIDGKQLWSERYQRNLDDIFTIQEEIARAIATNLDIELKMAEVEHASRRQSHIGIWDRFQKGMWHFFKFTDSDATEAIGQLRKLVEQTPGFAPALAALSLVTTRQLMLGESKNPEETLAKAERYAEDAVAADDNNSLAHMALARVLSLSGKHSRAIEEAQTAVDLNPSSSGALLTLAQALIWQGKSEEALPAIDMSLRLSPKGPLRDFKLMARAFALYTLDRQDEAELAARKAAYGNRMRVGGLLILIAILARQGRMDEAQDALKELLAIKPDVSLSGVRAGWTGTSNPIIQRFTDDLRMAGVPD